MKKINLANTIKYLFSTALALCALLSLPSPTQARQLQASDGAANDNLGWASSTFGPSGNVIAGSHLSDIGSNVNQGAAYLFRNLTTASGTVTEHAKLIASDGGANDLFGECVSVWSFANLLNALISSHHHDIGTNTDQGAAYLFRNLGTATGTVTENAKLVASDGGWADLFGQSVSIHGTTGLVGANWHDIGANTNQGAAYVFRNLDTATGTITENAKLVASDGAAGDEFGWSVSLSFINGLVGAPLHDIGSNTDQGAAYVYRNLNTVTGTVTQDVKLVASDGSSFDRFGHSVHLSGGTGIVGAYTDSTGTIFAHGSAYVFRNLNTATGTVTEDLKLLASDFASGDHFGISVSQNGQDALVGAKNADVGANTNQGAAYIFRGISTSTGTINEYSKIFASNGAAHDSFGSSVSLDIYKFVVGAGFADVGSNIDQGKAYFGDIRTFMVVDMGLSSATDGLSFENRGNWIIGQVGSNHTITLTSGDSGNVGRVGLVNPTTAQTYIGQLAGSNNNTLHVESGATLTSNSINVGASGNSGNELRANGTINLASGSVLNVFEGNILSGTGTIQGHAGNTTNNVVISGSLRPGSGAGGSGIGTLTRNNGDVTWNGNASSPWVFELGIAKATMALANTSGTRDLLNITSGDFLKGTGSSFVFDFAGTGWGGWYKLVDWTGTTNFSATDFTAININPVVTSYSFYIDNGPGSTTALYIYMVPEPQVWAVLSAVLGALVVIRQRLRKAAGAQSTTVV